MSLPQLQADVAAIPSNTIAVFSSFKPLLKTLSADNVQPLAVLQIQDIGSLFHVNGPFAEQLPNYLRRCTSARLERLGLFLGWEKDDTASLMAQTPGGRAAALVCLMIEEVYPGDAVGDILYELAEELISADQRNCSIAQLRDVSKVLATKLQGIGFGTHLAEQVTRIREVYLYMNKGVPRDLLDVESTSTLVQLFRCLHIALADESSSMRYEGTTGAGYAAAIFTALCPEDTLIIVEGEIIHAGARQSIVLDISLRADQSRIFNVTSLNKHKQGLPPFLIPNSEGEIGFSPAYCRVKWKNWLSLKLDFILSEFGIVCTSGIKQAFCDLIASIAATKRVHKDMDGYSYDPHILLGQSPLIRIRNSLKDSTGFEPSINLLSSSDAFAHLLSEINLVTSTTTWPVCDAEIPCDVRWDWNLEFQNYLNAMEGGPFGYPRCFDKCPSCESPARGLYKSKLMAQLINLIRSGFASLFIHPFKTLPPYSFDESNITVPLGVPVDDDQDCWHEARRNFYQLRYLITGENKLPPIFRSDEKSSYPTPWPSSNLFDWIFLILGGVGGSCAEVCQSVTVFSGQLVEPQIDLQNGMIYYVFDGILHDGKGNNIVRDMYSLSSEYTKWEGWGPALEWERPSRTVSNQGVHKYQSMAMTYYRWAGQSERLILSCSFQWNSRIIEVDFTTLLRRYLAITLAEPCQHQLSDPLTDDKAAYPTSVGAPYGPKDTYSRDIEALAKLETYEMPITMTKGNLVAQLLCLSCPFRFFDRPYDGKLVMHQGASCINCAWNQARALGCTMIIGS